MWWLAQGGSGFEPVGAEFACFPHVLHLKANDMQIMSTGCSQLPIDVNVCLCVSPVADWRPVQCGAKPCPLSDLGLTPVSP